MIQLTDFTKAIDTYKKNFDIRNKRFSDKKKKDIKVKREEREKKIESSKIFSVKRFQNKAIGKSQDILDTAIRFAGFALLGVIVKNLDKIISLGKNIIEKIKEISTQFKNFFNDKLKPLFFDALEIGGNIFNAFKDVGDFIIEMNPFRTFESLLDTVTAGIIGIATKLGRLNSPPPPGGSSAAVPESTKKPSKSPAQSPVNQSVVSKEKLLEKAKKRQLFGAEAKAAVRRASVKSRRLAEKLVDEPVKTRELVTAGSSSSTKPSSPAAGTTFGQRITADTPELFNKNVTEILKSDSLSKINQYIENQRKLGIEPDPQLVIEANERAKQKAGLVRPTELEGKVKTINQSQIDRARAFGDLRRQGVGDVGKPIPQPKLGDVRTDNLFDAIKDPKLNNVIVRQFDKLKSLDLSNLTKGLDFRFNPMQAVKGLFTLKSLIGAGLGIGAEFVADAAIERIQKEITPYEGLSKIEQDAIGITGLVSGDRILKVRAERISRLPKAEREKVISKLKEDTKRDDFFGNITGINAQLKYMADFILLELGIITDEETKKTSPNKRADEDNYDSGGNKIKIGDTVGYDISRGLNSSTTYDNQGRFTSREVVMFYQERIVEVPV